MNNPTKLLNTDIIAVEVPRNTKNVTLGSLGLALYFRQKGEIKHINLPFENLELLGESTEDEISFDVEPYVEKMYFDVDGRKIAYFKDYNPLKKLLHDIYCFTDKNQSFKSLLQASGLNWVNPFSNKCKRETPPSKDFEHLKQWQEAESKKLKGKLIFLKIVK